jgi:hypothetical protein
MYGPHALKPKPKDHDHLMGQNSAAAPRSLSGLVLVLTGLTTCAISDQEARKRKQPRRALFSVLLLWFVVCAWAWCWWQTTNTPPLDEVAPRNAKLVHCQHCSVEN